MNVQVIVLMHCSENRLTSALIISDTCLFLLIFSATNTLGVFEGTDERESQLSIFSNDVMMLY